MDPQAEEIFIEDIAHALSMQCRFNGMCSDFYSVAQHSYLVSYACDPDDAFWGLMHDASEAYLGDMISPLKEYMKEYKRAEGRVMRAVCKKFYMDEREPDSVIHADRVLLATEKRDLTKPEAAPWGLAYKPLATKIVGLSPSTARTLFLERFHELYPHH